MASPRRFATPLNLTYNNRSERIHAELVSGTWFDTLGLTTASAAPSLPTTTASPAPIPSSSSLTTIGSRASTAIPAILNQTVLLNGHPMTVVGVTAPDITASIQAHAWTPWSPP